MIQKIAMTDKTRAQIQEIIAYAKEYPFRIDLTTVSKTMTPGDDRHYSLFIGDFKVVYSEEIQPLGKLKHISISNSKKEYPSTGICEALLKEFGFKSDLNKNLPLKVWMEKMGNINAANIIEFV